MSEDKFDKVKYNNDYNKNNYVKPTIRFRRENYGKIEGFCAAKGYSVNDFVNRAVQYIIDNNIDLNADK